jgi:DNA mismatch repair protein MutS
MAGLPSIVIDRAREILDNLESHSLDITNKNGTLEKGAANEQKAARQAVKNVEKQDQLPQMSLFSTEIDPNLDTIKNKIEACDPNRMTPIESLLLLTELKRLLA